MILTHGKMTVMDVLTTGMGGSMKGTKRHFGQPSGMVEKRKIFTNFLAADVKSLIHKVLRTNNFQHSALYISRYLYDTYITTMMIDHRSRRMIDNRIGKRPQRMNGLVTSIKSDGRLIL